MSREDVKVLGMSASPFVTRVRIVLNLKGIDYEFVQETLYPKSELLLKSNPVYKKIPVLFHANRTICESLVILQYVDETWSSGHPILPADPYDRATARFWATYIDNKFYPALSGIVKAQTSEARKASIQQVMESIALLEELFVKCSQGRLFFGGDRIGYVDIALGCFLGGFKLSERFAGVKILDEEKVPGLAKWAERFCSDAAVKVVMPQMEELVKIAQFIMTQYNKAEAASPGPN